ncbi:MAG: FKBP-type peptidyl-prolyl cis-trans isomerase [Cyclobacteriaceae bacterium]
MIEKIKNGVFGLVLLSMLVFVSCLEGIEPPEQILPWETEQFETDQNLIKKYLDENNISYLADTTYGLKYVLLDSGNETRPNYNSDVTVNYAGWILGDTVNFDAGDSVTFPLNRLIPGWIVLMPYMGVGGTMEMYIPSSMAYGTRGAGSIPPNSNLVFRIDLLDVD